jgi:hypothetical protein
MQPGRLPLCSLSATTKAAAALAWGRGSPRPPVMFLCVCVRMASSRCWGRAKRPEAIGYKTETEESDHGMAIEGEEEENSVAAEVESGWRSQETGQSVIVAISWLWQLLITMF